MSTFRLCNPEVEAVQYRPGPGGTCQQVLALATGNVGENHDEFCSPDVTIEFGAGLKAEPGDYVVLHADGCLSVMTAEKFEAAYEAVAL